MNNDDKEQCRDEKWLEDERINKGEGERSGERKVKMGCRGVRKRRCISRSCEDQPATGLGGQESRLQAAGPNASADNWL